jgi:hypothetical protein
MTIMRGVWSKGKASLSLKLKALSIRLGRDLRNNHRIQALSV